MSSNLYVRGILIVSGLVLVGAPLAFGQTGSIMDGTEYKPAGSLVGDQMYSEVRVNQAGGFLVWQDNNTDGDGSGISAQQLGANFSALYGSFPVNTIKAGDQENPGVSLLNSGVAAFVWQGGAPGFPHIFARFLSGSNLWTTAQDVPVNTFTNDIQVNPAVATLTNGDVVVAWASYNQAAAGSMQDVYARRFTPAGAAVGGSEVLINQTTTYNQRTPVVAALANGGFVVAWVSEQQRFDNGVDIYARLFNAAGAAVGNEFLVNTGTNVCANPSLVAGAGGGFAVAWGEKDSVVRSNSWDIYARTFSSTGVGGLARRINARLERDQIAPKLSFAGGNYLAVWTSVGQDGSGKGVYGRFLQADGSVLTGEFRVNTTVASDQMQPAVAGDGGSRFLVTWSGFIGGVNSFDLYAQRYALVQQPLPPLDAAHVMPLSATDLMVTWPAAEGYSVAYYEVYADAAASPTATVTNNWWTMNGLAAGSTHSFKMKYVLTDSRRSPESASVSGTTYVYPFTWGGIPYDWMIQNYGADTSQWPAAGAPLAPGGWTLLKVFQGGGNPLDPSTWLRTQLTPSSQGYFLSWNSRPGLVYQVQASANMNLWTNLGLPRYARGTGDGINVGVSGNGYYRVLLVR